MQITDERLGNLLVFPIDHEPDHKVDCSISYKTVRINECNMMIIWYAAAIVDKI